VSQPPQVRRSSLTSRAAVLALVMCTLVLMLAYPLQQYLAQRGVIAKLHRANAAAQQQVDVLAAQDAQWQDSAYVARQARTRLHYVMPGEIEYVLVGGIKPSPSAAPTAAAATPTAGTWYDKLWGTVKSADHPVVKPTSAAPLPPPVLTGSPAPITVSPSPAAVRQ
jgi:cell division protein FtsB